MKPRAIACVLSLVAALVVASVAVASSPAPAPRPSNPDITKLFVQAKALVRAKPQFAKAQVLEADGLPAGKGAVKSADKITRWKFVFDNPSKKLPSVTLNYSRSKGFAKPVGHSSPFLEDEEIKTAPKMTLAKAVSLLNHAGYGVGFNNVTLRDPLGPGASAPLYIFGLVGKGFVGVNTKTGKIALLS